MYMSDEKKPFTDVLKDGALKPLFNSQGNTRGRVTFSIILQTGGLHLIKKNNSGIFLNFEKFYVTPPSDCFCKCQR